MIIQMFNRDILKVLTIFSLSPGSRFLRKELKETTKLNNVNLDNAISILLNSNLIKKERNILFFNLDNKEILKLIFGEYKKLRELPLNIYFLIVDFIFFLSKFKRLNVYLFGSYAKLIFKENSDIDIAIVSNKVNEKEINRLVIKLESKYSKNIEIHYFKENFYKNKKDSLVKGILRNGIKLI